MVVRSQVAGCGSYLPARIVSNEELSIRLDTTDAWIVERTGIKQRHIAAEGQFTSDLATRAAKAALADSGVSPAEIDLIIVATSTPDQTFPATATRVQAALGITQGAAFDVQAVCTGFVYGMAIADSLLKTGSASTAIVIGAETFSRILDWSDRGTCVLFGDGAGAVVLKRVQTDEKGRGVLSTHLHADGRYHDLLYVDGGPSSTQTAGHLRMQGQEVFRHAVVKLYDVLHEALAANGLTVRDVDWLVPHQANRRIMMGTAKKLGLPEDRVIVTIDHHANTSAASIPLALAEATRDGRIKPGNLVLLEAIGGGITWGSCLIRW